MWRRGGERFGKRRDVTVGDSGCGFLVGFPFFSDFFFFF